MLAENTVTTCRSDFLRQTDSTQQGSAGEEPPPRSRPTEMTTSMDTIQPVCLKEPHLSRTHILRSSLEQRRVSRQRL